MSITSNIAEVIAGLASAEAAADDIVSDALATTSETSAAAMTAVWPRGQAGAPHSGDLWMDVQTGELDYALVNPADYASFVHDGLAARLVPRVVAQASEAPLAAIPEQLAAIIDGGV